MIKRLFTIFFALILGTSFTSANSTSTPVTLTEDEIINIWKPYTVRVTCITLDEYGNKKSYSDGSGLLSRSSKGTPLVVTNKHVLFTKNKKLSDYCNVYFPTTKEVIKVTSRDRTGSKTKDIANLIIKKPTDSVTNLLKNDKLISKDCKNVKLDSSEKIAILGYPLGSNKSEVSVIKGTITNYEEYFYVSNATIVSGYSGGVAISLKDNCYLGIPTYVKKDDLSKSLILDVNKMK